jgi:uncharacterized RDD family membrane protein YckC
MEQQSYLSDIEFNPVLASTGKRFLNYLIDFIVYYILSFLGGLFFGAIGQIGFLGDDTGFAGLYLMVFSIYFLYYFVTEFGFKGRTIGKLITGTKAVNEDGSLITAKTYLLRTLCRFVPFEPFSAFGGHPWHDKWTRTYVIDVKKTTLYDIAAQ